MKASCHHEKMTAGSFIYDELQITDDHLSSS